MARLQWYLDHSSHHQTKKQTKNKTVVKVGTRLTKTFWIRAYATQGQRRLGTL